MKLKRVHKSGDIGTEEFDEVYRSYLKPVYAFVAYRVVSRADAEDVTSATFEKAWRAFSRFDSTKGAVSTWLFTIARNCLNDHLRRQVRRPPSVELNEGLKSDAHDQPEDRLQALELRRELLVAIESLNDSEREILALKFGGSLNNREIGRLLSISESNAGTILYRSLIKLKNQLEGGIEND
ncbi:MAG: sigma-70 family RNA polymerase sigma factor [Thermoleophilia bacterium]|nr:sigma-70 family RNA polymerase sigma factor [Thermoleophilia bacterium]